MEHRVKYLLIGFALAVTGIAFAGQKPTPATSGNTGFDRVVDRLLAREAENNKALRRYSPLVETYLQTMQADREVGMVPVNDQYYLTRVGFRKSLEDINFHAQPGFLARALHGVTKDFRTEFVSSGFNWMMTMDMRGLDRAHYSFDYQGREFLGDVRCIVIDVTPKPHAGPGRFLGRVWVEDQDFNIVRFNGTFASNLRSQYLHFDTWRLNMTPGIWLPAYIYSEDLEPAHAKTHTGNYKAETRIWGYNVGKGHAENEFTEVLVDDASTVKDNSDKAQDLAPVAAERAWQRQAEDNVVERLERGGMLARTGEVDKVLNTVINNLEITNNIDIQPEVRCRVLLTSPLESFTMGHTIFVSRGLLDVLPDEASLAAMLAKELAHIVLGHPTDTTFAFKDRSIVSDQQLLARMHFTRTQQEEREADTKALALLQNSPYHDKLDSVGLFLRQVDARRNVLPHLIRSDMGNSLTTGPGDLRMRELTTTAPKLEPKMVTQLAALPLGGRIKVDPWNNRIEINKAKPVQLLTAREKMPLEVTPVFPHLTRLTLAAPAEAPKSADESKAVTPAPIAGEATAVK
jgi:Peptidase family M48